MHEGALERDLRSIAGVVSCAVAPNGIFLLVDEGTDARAIERTAALVAGRHGAGPVQVLAPPRAPALRLASMRAAVASRPRARAIGIAAAAIALLVPLIPIASRVKPSVPPPAFRPAPGGFTVSEVLVGGGAPGSPAAKPATSQARANTVAAGRTGMAPIAPAPQPPQPGIPANPTPPRPEPPREPAGGPAAPESCRHDNGLHRGWTQARGEGRATHRPECVPAGSKGGRWQ